METNSAKNLTGSLEGDFDPSCLARCAQLAMVLEVSASPKPGNVDRDHDYPDTTFEHFLSSAIGTYPVLEEAARSHSGVGALIHAAAKESLRWQRGGNTHFGAFVLLIPLLMAAGSGRHVSEIVLGTTAEDAAEFYRAFSVADVRVDAVPDVDLEDSESIDRILKEEIRLFDLMKLSVDHDLIANEWVNGFTRTFKCADLIREKADKMSINDAIVCTFLQMLAETPDTFIRTKFGRGKSIEVSEHASVIIAGNRDLDPIKSRVHEFDRELIRERVNPGSTADIIIGGLFVALVRGLWV
jgi:triphosphoribosyl-dephospho-CoA synthase